MLRFQVEGMSCGHCEKAVRTAIQALQADAVVLVDLATGHVNVEAKTVTADALMDAIDDAGYVATLLTEVA